MAQNLKKFVNPKFARTVPLEPFRRLLERHRERMPGFDFSLFDDDDEAALRSAMQAYFAGPAGDEAEGLVADLHRIAALGTRNGLEILMQEAARQRVTLVMAPGKDPAQEDPKHVALTAFLDHPKLFDAAANRLACFRSGTVAEYAARVSGVPIAFDAHRQTAFESALGELFESYLHGSFCKVASHVDGSETVLAITHGAPIATTPVLEAGKEEVLCYRPLETAFLSYRPGDGRLKLRRVNMARRQALSDLFAAHVLLTPGLFADDAAQDLYTLEPVEAAWPDFEFATRHDPLIRRVTVFEVLLEHRPPDLLGGPGDLRWTVTVRDRTGCALKTLRETCPDLEFQSGAWRLGSLSVRVDILEGGGRLSPVVVTIRPTAKADFKRERYEAQIMDLLHRNGFCRAINADRPDLAAE